jgi:hypothetical protein
VLRALFARSGNRCAFPGCTAPLVNEKNQFIAQVCHIEAAEAGGERFNATQTDERRRAYENLILLCYPHHIETDDECLYTAEQLRSMKSNHERVFGQKLFQIDESLLHKIAAEMAQYWGRGDRLHREHHVVSDLAIEIDAAATFSQLSDRAAGLIADLVRIQEYLIESDQMRQNLATSDDTSSEPNDFEMLYIGLTNTITKLSVALTQMDIKYLEEFLKLNPADQDARQRLEQRKHEFDGLATSAGYVD